MLPLKKRTVERILVAGAIRALICLSIIQLDGARARLQDFRQSTHARSCR